MRADRVSRAMVMLSLALGVCSLVAIGVMHLALTDIWHGEGSLAAEWLAVQVAVGCIVLCQLVALRTLWGVWRSSRVA